MPPVDADAKAYAKAIRAELATRPYVTTFFTTDAALLAHRIRDGRLILEPISIGKRCYVGNRAIVAGGATGP